jgi:hypothetical protein
MGTLRVIALCVLAACGDDGNAGGDGGPGDGGAGSDDASVGARPHPLYPSLDLDTLPGPGGGASGPYTPPTLPTTTRTVTAMTAAELNTACQTAGAAVNVPDGAGPFATIDLGNAVDCDITFGPNVTADMLFVGHLPGPVVAPAHRVRIRGGQFGQLLVDGGSTDLVFDGIVINNAIRPPAQRQGTAMYFIDQNGVAANRVAVINSVVRMVATTPGPDTDGCAYLSGGSRNVFFANNNIVTAGNRNAWGFRIGGGENYIFVDNTVRVSFHKLIRMNDGPVDYVYVKGGTWLREATLTSGGQAINDSFAQLGDLGTDHIYIHDPAVHLLSSEPVGFGASFGPGQVGKTWEARRIHWHATAANVVSDATMMNAQSGCTSGAMCDYGVGTHVYTYATPPAFPANPWRSLPAIAVDDPDDYPIAP